MTDGWAIGHTGKGDEMNNIIQDLRDVNVKGSWAMTVRKIAADKMVDLKAENARLRKALEELVNVAADQDSPVSGLIPAIIEAKAALEGR